MKLVGQNGSNQNGNAVLLMDIKGLCEIAWTGIGARAVMKPVEGEGFLEQLSDSTALASVGFFHIV
jgi:hypothetical protein